MHADARRCTQMRRGCDADATRMRRGYAARASYRHRGSALQFKKEFLLLLERPRDASWVRGGVVAHGADRRRSCGDLRASALPHGREPYAERGSVSGAPRTTRSLEGGGALSKARVEDRANAAATGAASDTAEEPTAVPCIHSPAPPPPVQWRTAPHAQPRAQGSLRPATRGWFRARCVPWYRLLPAARRSPSRLYAAPRPSRDRGASTSPPARRAWSRFRDCVRFGAPRTSLRREPLRARFVTWPG
jgi:hypothetical protein